MKYVLILALCLALIGCADRNSVTITELGANDPPIGDAIESGCKVTQKGNPLTGFIIEFWGENCEVIYGYGKDPEPERP